ncbi:MAG: hypothetical protein IPG38_13930 [Chitinophagaceae bacterium]|nr:hypothetical protein [Chitinophagaceae bacterium]
MKNIKISLVMLFALLVSVESFAQRGRGRNYKPYQYNRNQVTVHVGPRYNYRPAYRPYYRPNYRPAYRSVYRSPRAYVHYGPVFGVRVNVLPYGYNRIFVGPDPYYYNNGIYYRPYNNQYEVVAPPLHATVKSCLLMRLLPSLTDKNITMLAVLFTRKKQMKRTGCGTGLLELMGLLIQELQMTQLILMLWMMHCLWLVTGLINCRPVQPCS